MANGLTAVSIVEFSFLKTWSMISRAGGELHPAGDAGGDGVDEGHAQLGDLDRRVEGLRVGIRVAGDRHHELGPAGHDDAVLLEDRGQVEVQARPQGGVGEDGGGAHAGPREIVVLELVEAIEIGRAHV